MGCFKIYCLKVKMMIKSIFRATKKSINSYFLVPSLKALKVLPNNGELFLVDVGAAGEVEPRWKPFIDSLNYIGFEPDERSERLSTNQKNRFRIIKYFHMHYQMRRVLKSLTYVRNHKSHRFMIQIIIF